VKHTTIMLVKFKALMARLNLPLYATVGVLETLWLFAIYNARDGDMSRHTRFRIAAWMGWDGDVDKLFDALVVEEWLDEIDGKLSVHHWRDNCANWIKGVASESHPSKKTAAGTTPTAAPSVEPGAVPGAVPGTVPSKEPSAAPPNQTKPFITNNRSTDRPDEKVRITQEDFDAVRSDCRAVADLLNGRPGQRLSEVNHKMVERAVPMIVYRFESRHWLKEFALAIRQKQDLKVPAAYWKTCLRKKVEALGCDLNEELDAIVLEEPQCKDTSESIPALTVASPG